MKWHVKQPMMHPQYLQVHGNNPRDVHVVMPKADENSRLNASKTVVDTTLTRRRRLGRDRERENSRCKLTFLILT